MATASAIEWTDTTWNPLGGCSEISPGCLNCYAARMAYRCEAMGQAKYAGTTKKLPNGKIVWTGKINLAPAALDEPLSWRKPRRVFVNSMSDLFHEDVPMEFIDTVFTTMSLCPQHTFQVLTKRPERMLDWSKRGCINGEAMNGNQPLPNVWLGVSVEDQARAGRLKYLREIPASIRFVSIEPLIEDLGDRLHNALGLAVSAQRAPFGPAERFFKPYLDWVIIGGESGPGSRPCNIDWIRSIVQQCATAGVPAFVKQLGRLPTYSETDTGPFALVTDKKGGDISEFPEDLRVRQFPHQETPHAS